MGLLDPTLLGNLNKLKGLLGETPIGKYVRGQDQGVSVNGLKQALLGMPVFDQRAGEQDMAYAADAIGPGAMALTFAGVGAKTANKGLLAAAQKMDKAGADRGAIWNETGWFKGPEGKWRFEIDDSAAGLRLNGPKSGGDGYDRLAETLDHKQAFKAYPDLKAANVTWDHMPSGSASYSKSGPMEYINVSTPGLPSNRSSVLHEMQHAVQQREGFARGGNQSEFGFTGLVANADQIAALDRMKLDAMKNYPKVYEIEAKIKKGIDPTNAEWDYFESMTAQEPFKSIAEKRASLIKTPLETYKSLAGEAEARAVQTRMDFPPDKRKAVPPWESYDIPWDQLIVR